MARVRYQIFRTTSSRKIIVEFRFEVGLLSSIRNARAFPMAARAERGLDPRLRTRERWWTESKCSKSVLWLSFGNDTRFSCWRCLTLNGCCFHVKLKTRLGKLFVTQKGRFHQRFSGWGTADATDRGLIWKLCEKAASFCAGALSALEPTVSTFRTSLKRFSNLKYHGHRRKSIEGDAPEARKCQAWNESRAFGRWSNATQSRCGRVNETLWRLPDLQ